MATSWYGQGRPWRRDHNAGSKSGHGAEAPMVWQRLGMAKRPNWFGQGRLWYGETKLVSVGRYSVDKGGPSMDMSKDRGCGCYAKGVAIMNG